jgi:hypothetical protein
VTTGSGITGIFDLSNCNQHVFCELDSKIQFGKENQ